MCQTEIDIYKQNIVCALALLTSLTLSRIVYAA